MLNETFADLCELRHSAERNVNKTQLILHKVTRPLRLYGKLMPSFQKF